MVMKGYVILNKSNRVIDNRKYKTRTKAMQSIKNIIRNNSLKKRQMVGYIGLRIKEVGLYEREIKPMKAAKDFIWM